MLHPSSQTYFGFQWHGFFFVFRTLPFGWKDSAFIYHKLGLAISGAARSLGVPVSQYIDDRHVGQLFISPLRVSWSPSLERAQAAAYIMCYLLIEAGNFIGIEKSQLTPSTRSPSLEEAQAAAYIMCYLLMEAGYFIGIEKSQLAPSTWTRFLGFICDSVRQAFLIPDDKKVKFAALREDILSSPFVGLKTLQRFSGKVISFLLAIPGCKLYVREVFKAISGLSGSTRLSVRVEAALRTELRSIGAFSTTGGIAFHGELNTTLWFTLYCDASKKA